MVKFPVTIFLLVLFPWLLLAQDQPLLLFPLTQDQLKISKSIRKLSAANGISGDSLLRIINERIYGNITEFFPEHPVMLANDETIKAVFDSSTFENDYTTSYKTRMAHAKGLKKMFASFKSGHETRYAARKLSVPGTLALQQELLNRNPHYCIFINKIVLSDDNQSGFILHFEIYDRDSRLLNGDKIEHPLDMDRDMHFSAFWYYLTYAVDNCSHRLKALLPVNKTENTP